MSSTARPWRLRSVSCHPRACADHNSVGSNGHLELDFAIDRTGNVAPDHAAAYRQFGAWMRSCYGSPLATGTIAAGSDTVTITIPSGPVSVDRVSMVEGAEGLHAPLPPLP